jgi:hypothetical protein
MNRQPLYSPIIPNASRTPHLLPAPNGTPLLQRPPHNGPPGQQLIGGPSLLPPPGQPVRSFNGRPPLGALMQVPPGNSRLPMMPNQNQSMHNRMPPPPHMMHGNASGPPPMMPSLSGRLPHLLPPPGGPPPPMPNKSHLMPNPLLPSPLMNKSMLSNVPMPHPFSNADHIGKDHMDNGSEHRHQDMMLPNMFSVMSTNPNMRPMGQPPPGMHRPPMPMGQMPGNLPPNLNHRPPMGFPNPALLNPQMLIQPPPKIPSLKLNPDNLKSGEAADEEADKAKEFWIETKAGDAKVYYYNSRTRETSWTKPENCVILTHEQYAQQHARSGFKNGDNKLGDAKIALPAPSLVAANPFLPAAITPGMPPAPWTVQVCFL